MLSLSLGNITSVDTGGIAYAIFSFWKPLGATAGTKRRGSCPSAVQRLGWISQLAFPTSEDLEEK